MVMPGLMPPPASQHRERLRMMVAAQLAARIGIALDHRRAAEFAAPDHERVVEQAALLEVLDERGAGLVGLASLVFDAFDDFAVMIPAFVEKLHEAHAAFDQPAGEQAVHGKRRLARFRAIHLQRLRRFLGNVHQLRRAGLHPIRHLKGVDARGDLRIAHRVEMFLVQFLDQVERATLHFVGDAGGIGEKQHRVARFAEGHALINRRQKSAAVKRAAAAEATGGIEHHEAGQILRLAAQSVERPRAKAGPAKLRRAGLHQHLARRVVEGIGGHGFHDGDVVHDFGQMRQRLGNLRAALARASQT